MDTLHMNITDVDVKRRRINDDVINHNVEMINNENISKKPDEFFINCLLQDTRVRAIQNEQISRKYLLPALYEEKDPIKRNELRNLINKSICEEINLLSYVIHELNNKESKYYIS